MADDRAGKRIGVFLCHCGKNIAGGVDIEALIASTNDLDQVDYVVDNKFSCSEDGQEEIKQAITDHGLDRVIVAACDPGLHLMTFQRCGSQVGLDPSFVDLIDIRKWTMASSSERVEPEEALERARKLIALAVKRMALKRPIPQVRIEAEQSVLVIGAGIAGLEAALDLAEKGYQVELVERLPTIGGKMGLLYKVYPTNDCAPCILAPKTAYANMHPRINLRTNSEVVSLTGHVGRFTVGIVRHPRYVIEERCTGCGECVEACPQRVVDDIFAAGMGERKAIYIPYEQAIPKKAVIDDVNCLYFRTGACRLCEKACPTDAIDFADEEEQIELTVGAIVVATGFDEFDPSVLTQYGYDRYANVITQYELARILDIDGPTKGELIRPGDGRKPDSILMIQCVGSRDENTNRYCSGVCCMYALKHAQIIKRMVAPEAEVYICYIDMRTPGKDFEEYYVTTRELGVHFLRGRPSEIIERADSGNLIVKVEDADLGRHLNLEVDLVALSCAMIPAAGTGELAGILGLARDESGFYREVHPKLRPVETGVRGIFICGAAQGPKDIPQSIVQARAAASGVDGELRQGEITLPEVLVRAAMTN